MKEHDVWVENFWGRFYECAGCVTVEEIPHATNKLENDQKKEDNNAP